MYALPLFVSFLYDFCTYIIGRFCTGYVLDKDLEFIFVNKDVSIKLDKDCLEFIFVNKDVSIKLDKECLEFIFVNKDVSIKLDKDC